MAGVIVYSSNTDRALELLTAAVSMGQDIKAISINNEEQAKKLKDAGASVYKSIGDYSVSDTSAVTQVLSQAATALETDIILLSSDRRGKELAGRLAQKLNAGCLTDIKAIKVDGIQIECSRNAMGGATIAAQSIKSKKQVLAISPKVFKPAEPADGGRIEELAVSDITSTVTVKEILAESADSVDIGVAEILLAVGCGVQKDSNLPFVEAINQSLGGVIGCSKPVATDWKWFPEDRIIGLSGTICKPELALVLGVSGQVQFYVGVRDARVVVSINCDENALINGLSDYYMVADLNDILPQLKDSIK